MKHLELEDKVLYEDLCWCVEKILPMTELYGTTVFVTGGTGLIGSLFIKTLLLANNLHNTNIQVIAGVRSKEKACSVFKDFLPNNNLLIKEVDLCSEIVIEEELDYVLHTASITSSKYFITNPAETLDLAYIGTRNVLELARKKKVRSAVYLSSMEVYGRNDNEKEKVEEDDLGYIDILSVRSSYSEGKRIAECLCACYHKEYHVPIKIARLAQTFGAGIGKSENRVFAQFARSVINGKDIVLHTSGESWGNYCYTRDCLYGLIILMLKGKSGQSYNLTNEKSCISIKNMAELVAGKFGNGKSKVIFDIPNDSMTYGYAPETHVHLSAEKMNELGWCAEIDLEEAYQRMISSLIIAEKQKEI
ncbi:nucleotide sugar dehydratase [Lactonifactor longoviformis]|uniref:Nucleoside-diphosphate-sugar epimerase n=1 Tax=Lactonifactor longoviformis DSM 17459 TaxID=1122155 RepID=A0A1M5APH4_9CLOT|nr:NAD-dependent epimerase/dehydratase family protein [Lactonifactor longoviformis]POP30860.1 nucleotide sugar dehydratase [Lactonifactor longoviformis]SHF31812.1 Nucleoside-diphosphate-sugar epimerase [Lactonifactor longoviformis DSM 17459]